MSGYVVSPGGLGDDDGPEEFSDNLAGLLSAMSRAGWLSVSCGDQEVHLVGPGQKRRRIRKYSKGKQVWPLYKEKPMSCSDFPPPFGIHGQVTWGDPPRCIFCGHRVPVNGIPPVATRKMPFWRWPGELIGRWRATRHRRTTHMMRNPR